MKRKDGNSNSRDFDDFEQEIDRLNAIDALTTEEFVSGETVNNGDEIDHDGVELSIQGSDIDDDLTDDRTEPGEIGSSDEEVRKSPKQSKQRHNTVQSKVVKVGENSRSRFNKFSHLRNDPEFKDFLEEIIDNRVEKKNKAGRKGNANDNLDVENVDVSAVCESAIVDVANHDNHENQNLENENINTPKNEHCRQLIKSLSDTTIYSPALRRASNEDVSLMEKNSNFVESIRLDSRRGQSGGQQSRDRDNSNNKPVNLPSPARDVRRVEQGGRRPSASAGASSPAANQPDRVTDQILLQGENRGTQR